MKPQVLENDCRVLGLFEKQFFKIRVFLPGGKELDVLELPSRYTVDQTKTTIFKKFPELANQSKANYQLALDKNNVLAVEFARFVRAHDEIEEFMDDDDIISVHLFPITKDVVHDKKKREIALSKFGGVTAGDSKTQMQKKADSEDEDSEVLKLLMQKEKEQKSAKKEKKSKERKTSGGDKKENTVNVVFEDVHPAEPQEGLQFEQMSGQKTASSPFIMEEWTFGEATATLNPTTLPATGEQAQAPQLEEKKKEETVEAVPVVHQLPTESQKSAAEPVEAAPIRENIRAPAQIATKEKLLIAEPIEAEKGNGVPAPCESPTPVVVSEQKSEASPALAVPLALPTEEAAAPTPEKTEPSVEFEEYQTKSVSDSISSPEQPQQTTSPPVADEKATEEKPQTAEEPAPMMIDTVDSPTATISEQGTVVPPSPEQPASSQPSSPVAGKADEEAHATVAAEPTPSHPSEETTTPLPSEPTPASPPVPVPQSSPSLSPSPAPAPSPSPTPSPSTPAEEETQETEEPTTSPDSTPSLASPSVTATATAHHQRSASDDSLQSESGESTHSLPCLESTGTGTEDEKTMKSSDSRRRLSSFDSYVDTTAPYEEGESAKYRLLAPCPHWNLEPLQPSLSTAWQDPANIVLTRPLDEAKWFKENFMTAEHTHYVGIDPQLGPCCISVKLTGSKKNKNLEYISLLRTKRGNQRIIFSASSVRKSKLRSKPSEKDILRSIHPTIAVESMAAVAAARTEELDKHLYHIEDRQAVKNYKFGVLLCKDGQVKEEDMFANDGSDPDYSEFLEFLGDRVELEGWQGYRAGLDVKFGSTGKHSVHRRWEDFEIMFHVATMLPTSEQDLQQIEKKRHLGNDIIVIIFKTGATRYVPDCIASEFNQVNCVVSKDAEMSAKTGQTHYRIEFSCKDGVKDYLPALPDPPVFPKTHRSLTYLLTKLVNAEVASYQAPGFKSKIARTRFMLLKNTVAEFSPK